MLGARRPGRGSSWSPRTSGRTSGVVERGASGVLLTSGSPGCTGREDAGRCTSSGSSTYRRARRDRGRLRRCARGNSRRPGHWGLAVGVFAGGPELVHTGIVFVAVRVLHGDVHNFHSRRPQEVDDGPNVRPACRVAGDPCAIKAMAQKLGEAARERRSLRPGLACRGRGLLAPPLPLHLPHGARGL